MSTSEATVHSLHDKGKEALATLKEHRMVIKEAQDAGEIPIATAVMIINKHLGIEWTPKFKIAVAHALSLVMSDLGYINIGNTSKGANKIKPFVTSGRYIAKTDKVALLRVMNEVQEKINYFESLEKESTSRKEKCRLHNKGYKWRTKMDKLNRIMKEHHALN